MSTYKKKGIFILFVAFFVFVAGILPYVYAGTVGNTITVDGPKGGGVFSLKQDKRVAIKTAIDIEAIMDRDIKADASSGVEITSGEWYMAKLSCVLFDRVEPYVKLGAAHMKAEWNEPIEDVTIESDTNFAWAIGTKLCLWEFKESKIKLIADGLYRMADMDVENGTRAGSKVTVDGSKSRFLLREWQVAFTGAWEIDISGAGGEEMFGVSTIVPYAGVKYSDVNGRWKMVDTSGYTNNPGQIEADNNVGVVVGYDFLGSNSVSGNVEVRFIDETAMTGGLTVLF